MFTVLTFVNEVPVVAEIFMLFYFITFFASKRHKNDAQTERKIKPNANILQSFYFRETLDKLKHNMNNVCYYVKSEQQIS